MRYRSFELVADVLADDHVVPALTRGVRGPELLGLLDGLAPEPHRELPRLEPEQPAQFHQLLADRVGEREPRDRVGLGRVEEPLRVRIAELCTEAEHRGRIVHACRLRLWPAFGGMGPA